MEVQELKGYISRQLIEQNKILRLSAYSKDGRKYLKRFFYYRLEKHIRRFLDAGEPRWVIVPGLRGVGKTTILAQLYFSYKEKFKGRVLYVSLDEVVGKLRGDLYGVLDAYEELLGESFHSLTENVLLLVDEVHFDPTWQGALKSLYDKSRRVFIIATGSSAIAANRSADAARRSLVEKIYPLKFTEYIMLAESLKGGGSTHFPSKLGNSIWSALFESENATEVFTGLKNLEKDVQGYWEKVDSYSIERYIKYYSLPSVLLLSDDTEIYKNLNGMVDRIVEKDLGVVGSFSKAILAQIPSLLFLVASTDIRSLAQFAKDLRDIDVKTLINIFSALEDAELLLRIYPFSHSAPKRVRKPSKYLFLASSIRAALIHLIDSRAVDLRHKGKLLEDTVGMYLCRHISNIVGASLSYDASKGGADFIVEVGEKKIAIEVGWNKKDNSQVIKTLKKTKAHYGLVITNSPLLLKSSDNVATVPLEFFFLL
ncbi:MAG: ATP-binding protein [Candidatus Dadabacteria bacterium]|nr:MAG: ATP-binding protein [Candidatus Dadabacteria bacterium]